MNQPQRFKFLHIPKLAICWKNFHQNLSLFCCMKFCGHDFVLWAIWRLYQHGVYVQEQTKSVWGEEDVPSISLATGASTMHKLRWGHKIYPSISPSIPLLFPLFSSTFFKAFFITLTLLVTINWSLSAGPSHRGIVPAQPPQPLASSLSCNFFQNSVPMDWINRLKH